MKPIIFVQVLEVKIENMKTKRTKEKVMRRRRDNVTMAPENVALMG